jgi:ribosome-associated toxin RatA of RatAB toxin-antitoxin module
VGDGLTSSMFTVDRVSIRAPLPHVFSIAADVEGWPVILPHYRWVRMLARSETGGIVEMAASRPFGPLRFPTWWVSRMTIDRAAGEISYTHLRGITRGMDVVWRLEPNAVGSEVTVEHRWTGPPWPLVGRSIARLVIGPIFIHGIASRTLAGIKRHAEGAQ